MSKPLELLPPNARLDYTCKFCGRPGHVEFHDPPLKPQSLFNVALFVKMICCDRCYQYERRRRDLIYTICRQATKLVTVRLVRPDADDPDRRTFESLIRNSLVRLTKSFGEAVANYWRRMLIWEPDLVNQIMREPARTQHLLIGYLRAIKRT